MPSIRKLAGELRTTEEHVFEVVESLGIITREFFNQEFVSDRQADKIRAACEQRRDPPLPLPGL